MTPPPVPVRRAAFLPTSLTDVAFGLQRDDSIAAYSGHEYETKVPLCILLLAAPSMSLTQSSLTFPFLLKLSTHHMAMLMRENLGTYNHERTFRDGSKYLEFNHRLKKVLILDYLLLTI
jgi:hypothetical protein